jgi:transposase-like protein
MAKRKRTNYTPEFKAKALARAKELGSYKEAAKELGIVYNVLLTWQKQDIAKPKITNDNSELEKLRQTVVDQAKFIAFLKTLIPESSKELMRL